MAKLFIVGFPRDMEEVELVELFSNHGIVDNVTVVTDQITGENKGYGFISMADRIGADRAIEVLDQAEIDGRVISVRFAEDKTQAAMALGQQEAIKAGHAAEDSLPSLPRGKRPRLQKKAR